MLDEIFYILSFIFLIIGIVIAVLVAKKAKSNIEKSGDGQLVPFSTTIGVDGKSKPLIGVDGKPLIKCPAGKKVNIVSAISQVIDPYGQCDPATVSTTIKNVCGLGKYKRTDPINQNIFKGPVPYNTYSSDNVCLVDGDCGSDNFRCLDSVDENGKPKIGTNNQVIKTCQLRTYSAQEIQKASEGGKNYDGVCKSSKLMCYDSSSNEECSGKTMYGVCIDKNLCFGFENEGPVGSDGKPTWGGDGTNKACTDPAGRCSVRDVSAVIASQCDGQGSCIPTTLGPLPCSYTPITSVNDKEGCGNIANGGLSGRNKSKFCSLPFAYGFDSTDPSMQKVLSDLKGNSFNTTGNAAVTLGYKTHGLYTCI